MLVVAVVDLVVVMGEGLRRFDLGTMGGKKKSEILRAFWSFFLFSFFIGVLAVVLVVVGGGSGTMGKRKPGRLRGRGLGSMGKKKPGILRAFPSFFLSSFLVAVVAVMLAIGIFVCL